MLYGKPDIGPGDEDVGVVRRATLREVGKGLPLNSGERSEKGLNGSLVGEKAVAEGAEERILLLLCP